MTKLISTKALLAIILLVAMLGFAFGLAALHTGAVTLEDIRVRIDTNERITLSDADNNGMYDIRTADELYAFAAHVNNYTLRSCEHRFELLADIVVNEDVLKADGSCNGDGSNFRAWTPIGIQSGFAGQLNGHNHTVSGLYSDGRGTEWSGVGLFGRVYNVDDMTSEIASNIHGMVKNLGVVDSYFIGDSYVGGIAGIFAGSIENCYNASTVISTESNAGGISGCHGWGLASHPALNIIRCYNTGLIQGNEKVGGITGNFTSSGSYKAQILNSYNVGTVIGTKYVGGIVGDFNQYYINSVFNYGRVQATGTLVGAIAGEYLNATEFQNVYYLDSVGASEDHTGITEMTAEQFANGSLTFVLEDMGQNLDNGEIPDLYPNLNGAEVYQKLACDGVSLGYTNIQNAEKAHQKPPTVAHHDEYLHRWTYPCCGETLEEEHRRIWEDGEVVCEICHDELLMISPPTVTSENYASFGISSSYVGYYAISNANELFWFAHHVNNGDMKARSANAVLLSDVDLGGKETPWTPIGKTGGVDGQHYRGTFDGNDKTITGMYVEKNTSGIGFFGEVRDATIKKFTIYGEVVVPKGGAEKVEYVGGVFGSVCGTESTGGTSIFKVASYVNLTIEHDNVGRVGGFAGYANHQSSLQQNAWYGTFNVGPTVAESGIGGFIGRIQENSDVTLKNCTAYGTIINDSATVNIGGMIGVVATNANGNAARPTVERCIFAGEVSGTAADSVTAFGTWNGAGSLKESYYIDTVAVSHSLALPEEADLSAISAERLAGGEITYRFNMINVWRQQIGTDPYPILMIGDVTKAVVYSGYLSCDEDADMGYTNNKDLARETRYPHSKTAQNDRAATCSSPAYCSACDSLYGEIAPLAHAFTDPSVSSACTECGTIGGKADNNVTFIYDDTTKTLTLFGNSNIKYYDYEEIEKRPWHPHASEVKHLVLEEGITSLGSYVFSKFTLLETVQFPSTLSMIGDRAFSGCISLKNIELPDNFSSTISMEAFQGCKSLTTIVIPENTYRIERSAFSGCSSLTSVILKGDTQLEVRAFSGCSALKDLTAPCNLEWPESAVDSSVTIHRVHNDPEKTHICTACGENPTPHEDGTVIDHTCDYCGESDLGEHADGDVIDHVCDYCGEGGFGEHAEGDIIDHVCDYCGKGSFGEHAEGDVIDHMCDYCGESGFGEHADGDDSNHDCDYCNSGVGEECYDVNFDHVCDECGTENIGVHTDSATDNDHVCDYGCGETLEACTAREDDGDCTTAVTCLYCDHVCVEAKAEHTFGEWTVTKEASVTEKGSRSQSCDCGYTVTEEIPTLEIDEEPAADATVSDDTIAEPDDTAAENGDATVEDSDATAEEGCGSALIGTPLVLLALLGTAGTVLLKKKREA